MNKHTLILGLSAALVLSNSAFAKTEITIKNEGLYPEGISYSSKDSHFYISSVAKGEIWRVAKNGKSELFAKDKKFASAIGIQVDEKQNRLLVCISDPGVGKNTVKEKAGKVAGLAIFDLQTKKQIAYHELAQPNGGKGHFANDVTLDDKGNIYVTDSFSPAIYRISPSGVVTTLITHEKWSVKPGQFGLNGIAYHPNGFLIVAHYATGKLYKIDVDNPNSFTEIAIQKTSKKWELTGLDGILLADDRTLIVVNNDMSGRDNGNFVAHLSSDNNWKTSQVTGVMPTTNTFPTTLTKTKDNIFVLHAKLGSLFTGKPAEKTFEIEQVVFPK